MAIRHSSYEPRTGAVKRRWRPSGVTRSREASPGVMSLPMPAPNIRSLGPERLRPPPRWASEPSAWKSQTSLRLPPPRGKRCPATASVAPSGSQAALPNAHLVPSVIRVTCPVAASTTKTSNW